MEKVLGEKQPRKAASLFGKYRLLRPLKRSPFLENYLVQAESPPHAITILKRLHPLVVHRTEWVALFLNEVQQAATLWHPNVIRIYDLGQIDGIPYFVQPYLFGKKLQTLLSRSRSLPIPTGMALLLIRQLLEALDFVHSSRRPSGKPMAHGGLHPERIFIGFDGVITVGDFGLGWLEDPRSAIRSRYRAPESISERKGEGIVEATPVEDLFAASAILCELLGEFPEPIRPGMEPWGYLPASVRSILLRGLAAEPSARFQTAREMIAPMELILQSEYARLNLTNYIQAFFGKEIEAERCAFAKFRSNNGEGSAMEALLSQQIEPASTDLPFPPPQPVPSTPSELFKNPDPVEPPAILEVLETVAAASDLSVDKTGESAPEVVVKEKRSLWQPVWWTLFGLWMAAFVGVLFFSLYHTPAEQTVSSSTPTVPTATPEMRPDTIEPPPPAVEEKEEAKEIPPSSAVESLPSPTTAAPPTLPVIPSSSMVAAVAPPSTGSETNKEPAPSHASIEVPKVPTRPPAARTASRSVSPVPSGQIAAPVAPRSAAKPSPKLREEIAPQPKVEERPHRPKTNEEMLSDLIERQRRAFQSLDRVLYVQNLVEQGGGLERRMSELFAGGRPIRVDFEVFEFNVHGEEADLSLMQTARLQKAEGVFIQKSLLFWKLKREKDQWKIEKFNIIDKYPPVEVG